MRPRRSGWALAGAMTVMSSLAAAQPASDPAVEARNRYNQGTQAFAARRFAEAATNFEAAAAFKAHAVTLYTAGLAWEQAGQPERAADDYARALEVPGLSADQERQAREKLAAFEQKLGTLVVQAPAEWRVQLDELSEVMAPARLHAAEGAHALTVTEPGKPPQKREVKLQPGQVQTLELPEKAAEPPPRPVAPPVVAPPHAAAPLPLRRVVGFVAVGMGVGVLGAGVVLGINGLKASDAFDANGSRESFDVAGGLETWSTVAFVTGGVLAAGGLVLCLWPSSRTTPAPAAVSVGPRGAMVVGSF